MFLSGMLARRRTPVKAHASPWVGCAARWLPAVFWMGGIFYLSHQAAPMGATPKPWESIIAHLGLYAGLAVLLSWALAAVPGVGRPAGRWTLVAVIALTLLYGASDELHQAFVPGRTASMVDVALDAAGATMGAALVGAGTRLLRARELASQTPKGLQQPTDPT